MSAKFQTFWQTQRQNIRKVLDFVSGAITTYGATKGEIGVSIAGLVVACLNYAWFYFDNMNKITIEGLEESEVPGTSTVAQTLRRMKGEAEE